MKKTTKSKSSKKTSGANTEATKLLGLKLGDSTVLRVICSKYEGVDRVDIRVWYKTKKDTEFKPSGKGISMSPEHAAKVATAILSATKKSK